MVAIRPPRAAENGAAPEPELVELAADWLEPSRLLQYLPAIYAQDPFVGRFLRIFEDVHTPVRRVASTLPQYFDPAIAPAALQDTIATWVGVERSGPLGRLASDAWGELVREAVQLHRWRGTKRGLRRALELATGHTPLITDFGDGVVLGEDAHLGTNTRLAEGSPFHMKVTFECARTDVDEPIAHAIIRRYSPAHVVYGIEFAGSGRD